MAVQQHLDLIDRLHQRTAERKVTWERTRDEGIFRTTFPSYALALEICREPGPGVAATWDYYLRIYDDHGRLIEQIYATDFRPFDDDAGREAYRKMGETYDLARGVALGANQAIQNLLNALAADNLPVARPESRNLKVTPPKVILQDDEDLPF